MPNFLSTTSKTLWINGNIWIFILRQLSMVYYRAKRLSVRPKDTELLKSRTGLLLSDAVTLGIHGAGSHKWEQEKEPVFCPELNIVCGEKHCQPVAHKLNVPLEKPSRIGERWHVSAVFPLEVGGFAKSPRRKWGTKMASKDHPVYIFKRKIQILIFNHGELQILVRQVFPPLNFIHRKIATGFQNPGTRQWWAAY